MCYWVGTVSRDDTIHRISELEGTLEMTAKPSFSGPSAPLEADGGLHPREIKELGLRHHWGRHWDLLKLLVRLPTAPHPDPGFFFFKLQKHSHMHSLTQRHTERN